MSSADETLVLKSRESIPPPLSSPQESSFKLDEINMT